MARIAGIDLPRQKRVEIALTYIYGVGVTRSNKILKQAGIEPSVRVKDLSEEEVSRVAKILDSEGAIEGDLRKDTAMNIPAFGLGTFRLKGQTVIDSVRTALELGYRAIDTAQIYGNEAEVGQAIAACTKAQRDWAALPWEARASVFLKAADLLAGPWRQRLNAATMLGQSKTAFQAEIDAACELIDFWRFNVHYAKQILTDQPIANSPGIWNRTDHRPLEGFVYAITPFNFTAIGGNLPTSPAMMGNVAVWKPASSAMLSAYYIMKLLEEAGLPPGVINFVPGDAVMISDSLLNSRDLAGVHFTGSTGVFNSMWKTIGANMARYRTYPRIVGETGGKDFIIAHPSADPQTVAVAIARGGFEYQGQKCSAASRVYAPANVWPALRERGQRSASCRLAAAPANRHAARPAPSRPSLGATLARQSAKPKPCWAPTPRTATLW